MWLAAERGRAPATIQSYRRDLRAYAAWLGERHRAVVVTWAQLEAVVEAFEMWTPSLDDPDWGYAEALTALAAAALERGQARAARDSIERALLLAPDYRAALDLRIAMQSARSGERPL